MLVGQIPSHQQLLLPLLKVLNEHGPMRARDACTAVADELDVPAEVRGIEVQYGHGRRANLLNRRIRWVKQTAVVDRLMPNTEDAWRLSLRGRNALRLARPGVLICVARTDLGEVLWGHAMEAMKVVRGGSTQLMFTSTPFPLVQQREYASDDGPWSPERWMETMLSHAEVFGSKLTATGSLVLNLADVYEPGRPVLNTYQEDLVGELRRQGFNLCGKTSWFNPCKPRQPSYATKTRERLVNGMETFYWWSLTDRPLANNRNVLEPYSERYKRDLARGGVAGRENRRGAHQCTPGRPRYATDNGGKIPFNFARIPHESSNSAYVRFCKRNGIPVHPARMPAELANFWIRFVTREGDLVVDPMGGSLVTLSQCELLGRRCLTADYALDYLQGGLFRVREAAGLEHVFGDDLNFCSAEESAASGPAGPDKSSLANSAPKVCVMK